MVEIGAARHVDDEANRSGRIALPMTPGAALSESCAFTSIDPCR